MTTNSYHRLLLMKNNWIIRHYSFSITGVNRLVLMINLTSGDYYHIHDSSRTVGLGALGTLAFFAHTEDFPYNEITRLLYNITGDF